MASRQKTQANGAKTTKTTEPQKSYRSITEIRKTFYPNANVDHRQPTRAQSGRLQEELLGKLSRPNHHL